METKKTGLIVLVIILTIMVFGLSGYIVYDKFFEKGSTNVKEEEPTILDGDSDMVTFLSEKITSPYFVSNPGVVSSYSYDTKLTIAIIEIYASYPHQEVDIAVDSRGVTTYSIPAVAVENEYKILFGNTGYVNKTIDVNQAIPGAYFEKATYDAESNTYSMYVIIGATNSGVADTTNPSGIATEKKSVTAVEYSDRIEISKKYIFIAYHMDDYSVEYKKADIYNYYNDVSPFISFMRVNDITPFLTINTSDNPTYFSLGEVNIDKVFEDYDSKIDTYTFVFKKDTLGNYYLYETKLTRAA